jgi:hypothetical protein
MGDRIGDDADLHAFLRTLRPHGRGTSAASLIRDQADRDPTSKLYGRPQTFVGQVRIG